MENTITENYASNLTENGGNHTLSGGVNDTQREGNSTSKEDDLIVADRSQVVLLAVIFYLVLVSGVVGNSSLIRLITTRRSLLKRSMNLYILNIAIADLTLNVLGLVDGTQSIIYRDWLLGNAFCKIHRTILVSCLYVSILSLVAVACERFCAIMYPIKAHTLLGHRRVRQTIILIWIMAALSGSPIAFFNRVTEQPDGSMRCRIIFSEESTVNKRGWIIYKYVEFTFFFALPLLLQLILYSIIAWKLKQKQERPLADRERPVADAEIPLEQTRPLSGRGDNGARSADKSKKQAIRMLTTCVLVYFISYLPIQVLLFYNTVTHKQLPNIWLTQAILTTLAFINSAANPIIYYSCNKLYRTGLRDMYYRCLCRGWANRLGIQRGTPSSGRSSSRSGRRGTITNSIKTTSLH